MNIYDKINDLANALKTTPEVLEFKKANEKLSANPNGKKMVDDFHKKQMEMYTVQMQGKEPSKEQIDALNALWSVISMNSEVREYLEAEMKFSRLWEDMMKTLSEAADLKMGM